MATLVVMPKWGLSMEKGTITRWLKLEGDEIRSGEEIAEIESDKISNVLEAPADGVLGRIVVPVGGQVPIRSVIAVIVAVGEEVPTDIPGPEPVDTDEVPEAETASRRPAVKVNPRARRLADERGIDLTRIVGSGPGGMITVEDLEPGAAPSIEPKPVQRVHFYSDGLELAGLLYCPEGLETTDTAPGVVLCVGFTYLKELVLPELAKELAAAGYVSVVFDYRGFGASDGPKGRLIPDEQIRDARAAASFLDSLPFVEELAIVGLSLGGSHAVSAASMDPRFRAAVAMESPASGGRWLKSLRRHHEWMAFLADLERDRLTRVESGRSRTVDPTEIMVPDPASLDFLDAVYREYPQMRVAIPLESAEAIIEYEPERRAETGMCPLLLIHGADDTLVPIAESLSLAAVTGARLEIFEGMGHFDWVMPDDPRFRDVSALIIEFLGESMMRWIPEMIDTSITSDV
ncbi:MAG: alpha/beta fold hydrolase [Acidimicrobiia bacterium]|nr:alpha/beta fold hydrolase [Acidimicrobiia bacterium]